MRQITIKMEQYKNPVIKSYMGFNSLIDTGANIPVFYFSENNMIKMGAKPVKEIGNVSVLGIDGYCDGRIYQIGKLELKDSFDKNLKLTFTETEVFVPNILPIKTDNDGHEYLCVHPILLPATMFYGTRYDFDTINNKFTINIPANFPLERKFEINIDETGKAIPVVNKIMILEDYSIQMSLLHGQIEALENDKDDLDFER